jgi:arabinogalactan oligomer/maltooligosaccharide transport system permease protein
MKKRRKSFSIKSFLGTCLLYLELIVMAIIVLYPIAWIVGSSLSPTTALSSVQAIPTSPTLDNYRRLLNETNFTDWYKNTMIIAVLTLFFTITVTTWTAFVFARFRFKGSKNGLLAMMMMQMFPSFLSMTAIYVIFLNFGLTDNIYPLVILYVTGSIPYNIFLVRGYMLHIPKSLDEAAYIDGASKMQVFIKVVFPLSVPIISFMAVMAFMAPWMDYILPRLLLRSNINRTLAIGLFDLADLGNPGTYDITAFTAGCIIVGLPIATLYMVFQKYLLIGLTAGANKGD